MLDAITRFFRNEMAEDSASTGDDQHRLQVATSALLLEMAHADDEFTASEQKTVVELVRQKFQLTSDEAQAVIDLAESERRQSTDLYQFTRLISDHFTHAQKLAMLESLWIVVYSDGRLEAHEDHLIHKLGKLLGVKHGELIALKMKVKAQNRD
jgi:uncharacterized tellurite resistance protein B-like protein